ncbi:amidohydrolase [Flavobacteriaceae bacterium AU392]|nr:amidohydrolase [Flavobacteriaceae bacterium]RKM81397.1 amidohydrolase [Flavobacteriaceae bacterium AU392]
MKNNIIVIFILSLLVSCKSEQKEIFDMVLTNGNVINIETGVIEQQDIFINDGRIVNITAIGKNINFTSEVTVDASDKYVLPGFWDNHVHFRGGDTLIQANKEFLKLFMMNGITTVRDAGGDMTPSVIKWNSQIDKGELMGPTIFTSGPKLDGPSATWAGSLVVENVEDISKALDSLQKLKTDFVKIYDSRISREAFLETVSQATERGLITSGHMPFTVELKENIEAGIGAIEHLYYVLKGCSSQEKEITQAIINREYGFWQSMAKLIATYDETIAQSTFQNLKNNNVYVVPTLHIGNVLSYLDEDDHSNDAYLKIMHKGIIKTYQGRINGALNGSEKARQDRKALNTFFKELSKSLNNAGVNLLAGSDSGAFNSYTYPGISLHKELEAMVASGISTLNALQTSGYNGSKFLKKDKDYGVIAVGKVADLILLNANPLEDIKQTRNIYRVIKNNQEYNPKTIAEEINCPDCVSQ